MRQKTGIQGPQVHIMGCRSVAGRALVIECRIRCHSFPPFVSSCRDALVIGRTGPLPPGTGTEPVLPAVLPRKSRRLVAACTATSQAFFSTPLPGLRNKKGGPKSPFMSVMTDSGTSPSCPSSARSSCRAVPCPPAPAGGWLRCGGYYEHGIVGAGFEDEVTGELAALDVLQHGLHFLLHGVGDQAGPVT